MEGQTTPPLTLSLTLTLTLTLTPYQVAILPFYLTLVTDIGLPIECAIGFLTVFQVGLIRLRVRVGLRLRLRLRLRFSG